MKKYKILVPTDFSDYALNALDFAIGLAKEINSDIILLHTYIFNHSTFLGKKVVDEINNKRFEEGKSNLDQLLEHIKIKNKNIKATAFLKTGPPVGVINDLIELEDIDLVVMGTLGASGLKASIVGSYTADVIKKATRPVISIPPTASYNGIHKILCAADLHQSELKGLACVMDLAKLFKSSITIFNVADDEEKQQEKLLIFQNEVKALGGSVAVDYITENSELIVDSIYNLVISSEPDLLVTLGKHRNFMDRLFNKSVTRDLCFQNIVPLLVFPDLIQYPQDLEIEEDETFIFR